MGFVVSGNSRADERTCLLALLPSRVPSADEIRRVVNAAFHGVITLDDLKKPHDGIQSEVTWNDYAIVYDHLVGFDSSMRSLAQRVDRTLPRHGKIADFAGGVGIFTAQMAQGNSGREIWMFDFSDSMLAQGRQRVARATAGSSSAKTHLMKWDLANSLDAFAGQFDGAVMNDALYAFKTAEARLGVLRNIFRTLKPGAKLVLGDLMPELQDPEKLRCGEIALGCDAISNGSPVTYGQMAYMMLVSKEVLAKENPWMSRQELISLAERAGFRVLESFLAYHDWENVLVLERP